MKDYRPLWKEQAQEKSLSFYDCIQRCILIGMHTGKDFDEKVQVAMRHLDRSFTRSSKHGYDRLHTALRFAARPYIGIASKVLETDEEKIEFEKIVDELRKKKHFETLGVYYSYIFLVGDLIPEQTLVQGMHASMLLGQKLTEEQAWPKQTSAENLHFVIAKTGSVSGLLQQLITNGIKFSRYEDFDYDFDEDGKLVQKSYNKSLKSIMTYPVPAWKKPFSELELVRFESDRPS